MSGLARKLERINCVIDRLKDEVLAGAILIVEGEKDVKSLKEIGIESNVIAIKLYEKRFYEIVDEISSLDRRIILLMDFDKYGKEQTKRLAKSLVEMGANVNLEYWKNLRELLGGDIKDIEGLASYLETLRKKVGMHRLS